MVGETERELTGETNLDRLIGELEPRLDPQSYTFVVAAEPPDDLSGLFAVVREDEGWTLVAPGEGWARITLAVHSSLEAVGLTAAIARALADAGIAVNVIAAAHHDHIFVPWDRREEALAILRSLAAGLGRIDIQCVRGADAL